MSRMEQNLPNPVDRLGLLLAYADAMALAATGEDHDTMNEHAKLNFAGALHSMIAEAQAAYSEMVKQHFVGRPA